jgi:sialic acid synthase SpsE
MPDAINIAGRSIGRAFQPFIIAEMSGNHNQSLDRALAIVDAAAKTGAHALKLQTYTADTMTLDLNRDEFFIDDPNSLWRISVCPAIKSLRLRTRTCPSSGRLRRPASR